MAATLPASSASAEEGTSPARSLGRGAALMAGNSWAKALLQLASLVVLGRILAPSDYGLLGMVVAITGVAALVGDLGLSLAALQAKTLPAQLKSNLFWINALVGVVTGTVLAAVAPLLVLFYGRPELLGLTVLLAVGFPLNGIAVQFRVELNRRGEFGRIVVADVGGQFLGLVVAVVAALAGAGYWALGLQLTVAALASFLTLVALSGWRPGLPRRAGGLGGMLGFGLNTFGLQAVNYVSSNIDNVAVGRVLGAAALGFYSRAWTLVTLPMSQLVAPLTRVVLPALSRLEGPELRDALFRLQGVVSYALLGVLSALASVAPSFLTVVLGGRWVSAAPILETLTIGAAFQALGYVYYWGFLARARTGLLFLGELGGRIVMVVGILAVAHVGAVAVAAASSLGSALIWATGTFVTGPRAGIDSRGLAQRASRPFALFLGAYAACKLLRILWIDGFAPLPALLVTAVAWAAVVGAGLLIPAVRHDVLAVSSELRRLGRGRSVGTSPR